MESTLRRTWAEIDLDALAHNYETLRRRIGAGVKFLGVVKADAYGHGAVRVAQTLQELGADYLAVSSADEAMELRENGITMPVLILGHTPKEEVPLLIEHHITQAVTCQAKALEYSQEAVRCGGTLKVHIKVDTGMSRLGFLTAGEHFGTGVETICAACRLPGLEVEGIFTHFAVSDETDEESRAYTLAQFDLFTRVIEAGRGPARPPLCHPALRQQRCGVQLPGDAARHGASRPAALRVRRVCGGARSAPGDDAENDGQHHQNLSAGYLRELRRLFRTKRTTRMASCRSGTPTD